MLTKSTLIESDIVGLTAEITRVHANGIVTIWLKGYECPLAVRVEHLSLIAKKGRGVSSRRSATVSPDKVARLPICRQDLLTKHFGRRFEAQAFTRRRVEMGAHLVKVVVVNRQRIGVSR